MQTGLSIPPPTHLILDHYPTNVKQVGHTGSELKYSTPRATYYTSEGYMTQIKRIQGTHK